MQAAGHMFVSIQKIRSRRANGHTRKYCRNSPSNALAVTREAEKDWARQQCALPEREDYTLVAWYCSLYAPRTGGAYDSHHRTAGIAGGTRRRGCGVAVRGARATDGKGLAHRLALRSVKRQLFPLVRRIPGRHA